LENRRSENDEVSKRMWKTVEVKARKIGVVKIKRRRKEVRRERTEEEGREEKEET